MDTSKMLHIMNINSDKYLEMYDKARNLKQAADSLYKTLDFQVLRNQIVDLVENHYDLGTVREVYEIFGGYVNRSFGIVCEKDGKSTNYFVRKYKEAVTEQDMMLEHNLINYAISKGFEEAAGVFISKGGQTFVKIKEIVNGQQKDRYFAVYVYLEGLDKYTWINNESTPQEFKNLGGLMAKFHNFSRSFDPGTVAKSEPRIELFFPSRKEAFTGFSKLCLESKFHDFFKMSLPRILTTIDKNMIPAAAYAKMPQSPIHCDYHAGNVKFVGEECTGMFDFDWSKIDVRLFDICFGLIYCCASWQVATDGQLRLDDCQRFVEGYNAALSKLTGLEQLNDTERQYFPQMMGVANIYLINWCTALWYYLDPEGINDYEALYYLTHLVRLMDWIEDNKSKLADLIAKI